MSWEIEVRGRKSVGHEAGFSPDRQFLHDDEQHPAETTCRCIDTSHAEHADSGSG
jgi:hypothetical protein